MTNLGESKADLWSVPQGYKESFSSTTTSLEGRLQGIDRSLRRQSGLEQRMPAEYTAERQRIQGEEDSVEQFSSKQTGKARSIAFEDVSAAEDAQQVIGYAWRFHLGSEGHRWGSSIAVARSDVW